MFRHKNSKFRILAIAFYQVEEKSQSIERTTCETLEGEENILDLIEKNTLLQVFQKLPLDKVSHNCVTTSHKITDKHAYFAKTSDNNLTLLLVDAEKKVQAPLSSGEYTRLFSNIHHFRKKDPKKLQEIILKPVQYSVTNYANVILDKIESTTAETRALAIDGINKALERGEQIELLLPHTTKLKQDAIDFNEKAEDLNACSMRPKCGRG